MTPERIDCASYFGFVNKERIFAKQDFERFDPNSIVSVLLSTRYVGSFISVTRPMNKDFLLSPADNYKGSSSINIYSDFTQVDCVVQTA